MTQKYKELQTIKAFFQTSFDKKLWHSFIRLGLLYSIGVFAIIRANRLYLDDIGRSLYGYTEWAGSARPFTELLAWFFYLGDATVDASPFTQIIAVVFLACGALSLCIAFKINIRWTLLLALIPIGLSPYELENLSYRFDAPYMALALLFGTVPFLFYHRCPSLFFKLSLICLFACASIYQAALSVYLAISCYILLIQTASRRTYSIIFRSLIRLGVPFIIAIGIYALQAVFWIDESAQYEEYIEQHSTIAPLWTMPQELLSNATEYCQLIYHDWSSNNLGILFVLLAISFASVLILRWWRSYRTLSVYAVLRLFLLVLWGICFIFSPLGIQALLENPVWSPRTFCGFGVVLSLMMIGIYSSAKRQPYKLFCGSLIFLIALQLVIFSQVYGNLLTAQSDWERTRIGFLAQGLSQFIEKNGDNRVTFIGSIGRTPLLEHQMQRYPLLGRLVSVPLTKNWRWGYEQLKLYGVNVKQGREFDAKEVLTLMTDTPVYKLLHASDGTAFVRFNTPK